MNVIFDMETGDPDDLITLLLLLNNPDVQLRGITCYQGSPLQIGLIHHVLSLANMDDKIPVGGWNCEEPTQISDYYTNVIGSWENKFAQYTPVECFEHVFKSYPDTHVLTGAPLTNISIVLEKLPLLKINHMTTQGGYLGQIVPQEEQLSKFKGRKSFRTYNLGNDIDAFDVVNNSPNIADLTYVTKDLCHGFLYTPEIHSQIHFTNNAVGQLLNKCLGKYANEGKSKAMHDPLAMLIMLEPSIGKTTSINMQYRIDERGHPVFSSNHSEGNTYGLISYDKKLAWNKFMSLCEYSPNQKNNFRI